MQVHVHSPAGPGPGHAGAADIEALVRDLIGSDATQFLAIDVRAGPDGGGDNVDDDVHCRLTARLRDGCQLGANHAAPTLVRALHEALRQIRCAMERRDAGMLA